MLVVTMGVLLTAILVFSSIARAGADVERIKAKKDYKVTTFVAHAMDFHLVYIIDHQTCLCLVNGLSVIDCRKLIKIPELAPKVQHCVAGK